MSDTSRSWAASPQRAWRLNAVPGRALTGHRSTLRKVHRPLYNVGTEHGAGFRYLSDGWFFASSGDWGIRQSSFRHITRVPALVPVTFRIGVSHWTQKPPFEFLPAELGIRRNPCRRRAGPGPAPGDHRGPHPA